MVIISEQPIIEEKSIEQSPAKVGK